MSIKDRPAKRVAASSPSSKASKAGVGIARIEGWESMGFSWSEKENPGRLAAPGVRRMI